MTHLHAARLDREVSPILQHVTIMVQFQADVVFAVGPYNPHDTLNRE